jgi:alanyl-tRNA synthetase
LPDSDRLYYSDPFLRSFAARIVNVRPSGATPSGSMWQVSLDHSAFYPTSGGQPFDTGLLRTTWSTGSRLEIPVDQVEEDDNDTVWHLIQQPLAIGTEVECEIDWRRRFDHMQQHTGQHLLSAVFVRELQASTVSFHLGEQTSTIDLAATTIAHHSLERVERICNEIIGEDRPVTISYASRAEAETMLASGELRKLPDREGTIRVIDIADLDRNACGGTHVRATGQIGGLLIRRMEKVSRGLRVEFVCGLRAIRTARADAAVLTETSGLLSTGAPELPGLIKQMLADSKTATKERQRLREELATYQASELVKGAPVENGIRFISHGWKDRNRDHVRMLAVRTASAAPSTVALFRAEETEPARIFLARSPDLKLNCGQILKEALASLGLRGGGSPDLAQGEISVRDEPALHALVIDAVQQTIQAPDKGTA